jgi:hypothetical protein
MILKVCDQAPAPETAGPAGGGPADSEEKRSRQGLPREAGEEGCPVRVMREEALAGEPPQHAVVEVAESIEPRAAGHDGRPLAHLS